jgi:hypothetical protein
MKKYVLLKAAVITIVIFSAGILVGMWLDGQRYIEIKNDITDLTIDWNDARLQSLYYQTVNGEKDFCAPALETNKHLSEKIFSRGEQLERYEEINRFSDEVLEQKKIYALLQMQLWMNSVTLKKKCDANYTTALYFYSHYAEGIEEEQQDIQSSVLVDAIHRCNGTLVVFPIPIDMEIDSIDIIKLQFNITSVPAVLINEKTVLDGLQTAEQISEQVGC